ncbi:N-acetylmuramoyl-L-alanine amidase family protein [Halalkalibacter akibai]|uniref:N-acetylmuramoyl-L-alanine amidase n=1 Tax=Halalkalibacter akibai (strain ATCC 43226 / DSM 21942 / CIP 109018 / JCM 9157 / 1139) TaxID=1236973 RepID=W4QNN8_HALA3|nr:N-acetylmuramoyl-L-alanine amidase [Halalkalibacter akibai]GAE33701.1 N-acetylmuramoyl-L-alanine amidase [Halalkalibacter akibai JCM 9157]
MFKLYLDPGHGGSDTGATGNGLQEKDLTLDIALRIRDLLERDFQDVDVRMSRTDDVDRSLSDRSSDANNWGADYFLSIHINGFDGSAQGYEDYIYSGLSDSSQTAQYRDIMHEEITSVNELSNRGKQKANFHVLRETSMPALLTENGFIDNTNDAEKMQDSNWLQTVAEGHVNGLARAFNLQRSEQDEDQDQDNDTVYRVIVDGTQEGAYREHQNILNAVSRNLGQADSIVIERV